MVESKQYLRSSIFNVNAAVATVSYEGASKLTSWWSYCCRYMIISLPFIWVCRNFGMSSLCALRRKRVSSRFWVWLRARHEQYWNFMGIISLILEGSIFRVSRFHLTIFFPPSSWFFLLAVYLTKVACAIGCELDNNYDGILCRAEKSSGKCCGTLFFRLQFGFRSPFLETLEHLCSFNC